MKRRVLNSHLKKNRKKNISILGFIQNYPVNKIIQEGSTFLILGESDCLWTYISSNDEKELGKIIKKFDYETKYFASLEEWMIPIVTRDKQIDWELNTYRYILPKHEKINSLSYSIKELNTTHAEYIYNNLNYQALTSVDYIKERIENGISAGIFENGELAAWGLTHDDGALGFLNVIPEFRGKGYGKNIVKSLIKKKRKLDQPVFANIEPQNIKSKNLFTTLGFSLDREISWVKVI
ncbi:hypothetical protein JCM16358_00190 [Halanaerocella petrolearia]